MCADDRLPVTLHNQNPSDWLREAVRDVSVASALHQHRSGLLAATSQAESQLRTLHELRSLALEPKLLRRSCCSSSPPNRLGQREQSFLLPRGCDTGLEDHPRGFEEGLQTGPAAAKIVTQRVLEASEAQSQASAVNQAQGCNAGKEVGHFRKVQLVGCHTQATKRGPCVHLRP